MQIAYGLMLASALGLAAVVYGLMVWWLIAARIEYRRHQREEMEQQRRKEEYRKRMGWTEEREREANRLFERRRMELLSGLWIPDEEDNK